MKKLLLIISLYVKPFCMFAYNDSYEAEDNGLGIIMETIIIIVAILNTILFFKIWGMTNNVKEFKDKYIANLKSTEYPIVTEYYTTKELYGKEAAIEKLKNYIITEYNQKVGSIPNRAKTKEINEELTKKLASVLEDANISLPSLCDFLNYQDKHNGGFPIGGTVKVIGNPYYKHTILSVDVEARRLTIDVNGSNVLYNFDEVELVEE